MRNVKMKPWAYATSITTSISLLGCAISSKPGNSVPIIINIPNANSPAQNPKIEKKELGENLQVLVNDLKPFADYDSNVPRLIPYRNPIPRGYSKGGVPTWGTKLRPVYSFSKKAVKISTVKSKIYVSFRDVYHNGELDLEFRIPTESGENMSIRRVLPPYEQLDEAEECIKSNDPLGYFVCTEISLDDKVIEEFEGDVSYVHRKWNERKKVDHYDQHFVGKLSVLQSGAFITVAPIRDPYK
jgi:hypothetical protein